MTQELVKRESTELAPSSVMAGMDLSMMILPTLAMRQNTFKKDYMKKIAPGQAILRPTNEIVCGLEKKARFVVVGCRAMYRISEELTGRTISWEPYVEGRPWKFTMPTGEFRRDSTVVAHVLFEESIGAQLRMIEDLKAGNPVDPADFILPCRINFARKSLNAGKVLMTHCQMSKMANSQSPAAIVFELWTKEEENDKGHWFSYECAKATKDKFLDKDKLEACNHWVSILAHMDAKAHDDDDSLDMATPAVADAEPSRTF